MADASEPALPRAAELTPPTSADEGEWTHCSPRAALFFLWAILTGLVKNVGQIGGLIALAAVLWAQGPLATLFGALGLLALFLIVAVVQHWCFRFRIDATRIRIRQGVFRKTEVVMQFDRVQGVVVEQPFFCRLLNLVSIGFDTAGSSAEEGRLPAVAPSLAADLRARVEGQRASEPAPMAAGDQAPVATPAAPPPQPGPLLRLRASDMVRIGLADRSAIALVAAGLVGWHTIDPSERGRERYRGLLDALTEPFAELGPGAVAVGVAGGLLALTLALLIVTTAAAFLRFHGFQVFAAEGNRSFRTERGLLSRTTAFVERRKIQQIKVYQGLVMRCMGRFRLRAPPASGGPVTEPTGQVDTAPGGLRVPLLTPEQLRGLAERVFGAERGDLRVVPRNTGFVAISPLYIRARTLSYGVAPALVGVATLYPFVGFPSLACLAWPPLVGLMAWQLWRRRGYMATNQGLAWRSGFMAVQLDVFLFRKVQCVCVGQSPLQRRRGLATLDISLASGPVTLPYIDLATARALRDYMLYKVEAADLPWY